MKKFIEYLNKYESLIELIGIIVTVIGFFVGICTISNAINANFANLNVNEISINGLTGEPVDRLFYEAQVCYDAGNYSSAMRIYQEIQNERAEAKSNIGYLYAHGLGVEQNTQIAGNYYKQAYEMGYKQALQNYISINLTIPCGYAKTLETIKYGYGQNDETAIRYLAACLCGKLPDMPSDKLKELADEFMALDTETQLLKLKGILQFVSSEIVFFSDNNQPPESTDFVRYVKTVDDAVKREIVTYGSMTDPKTNETFIVPVNSAVKGSLYWKMNYSFYMGQYCPADEFSR